MKNSTKTGILATAAGVIALPFIMAFGIAASLWKGYWASKILDIGYAQFGWRQFSITEVLVASLAFGILARTMHSDDSGKHDDSAKVWGKMIGIAITPVIAWVIAVAIVAIAA